MTHKERAPVLALAGATAVGKSAVAMQLAADHPIEIISADSMQVYRRLDAGTAKPSAEERAQVRHHLIDVADPDEKYDLARFLHDAIVAIDDIRTRGHIPLVVGGTGLYLKSLMTGIFAVPSRDAAIRAELMQRAEAHGLPALHEELRRIDPPSADRISCNDSIRIVRALEVYRTTGRTMTDWHHDKDAPHTPSVPLELVVLDRPREVLNQRIGQRVRAMLQAGWIEEVRGLLADGLSADLHSFKALGYRQIAQRLIDGAPMDDLEESIAKETRQFAKRQRTWFRAMKTATWLDAEDQRQAVAMCEKLLRSQT